MTTHPDTATRITLLGILTDDPELWFDRDGQATSTFRVAVPRGNDRPVVGGHGDLDDPHDIYRIHITGNPPLAEAVAARLCQNHKVVVTGRPAVTGTESWYGVHFPVRHVHATAVSAPFWMVWPGWATTEPVRVEIVDEWTHHADDDGWRLRNIAYPPYDPYTFTNRGVAG